MSSPHRDRPPVTVTLACLVTALAAFTGCGKSDPGSASVVSPKEAASQLDEAFATAEPELQQNIRTASEALREGQYEKAVVAIEVTRSTTNLTLEQGMAVHSSMIALEQNLINAAANGDAKAQRAYELLKRAKRN